MTCHPSPLQYETLVSFMEANRNIARGEIRYAHGKVQARQQWDSLVLTLNSIGGAVKDKKGWIRFWSNKKYFLRRQLALRKFGGPLSEVRHISPIDERVLAIIKEGVLAPLQSKDDPLYENIPDDSEKNGPELHEIKQELPITFEEYSDASMASSLSPRSEESSPVFTPEIASDNRTEDNSGRRTSVRRRKSPTIDNPKKHKSSSIYSPKRETSPSNDCPRKQKPPRNYAPTRQKPEKEIENSEKHDTEIDDSRALDIEKLFQLEDRRVQAEERISECLSKIDASCSNGFKLLADSNRQMAEAIKLLANALQNKSNEPLR